MPCSGQRAGLLQRGQQVQRTTPRLQQAEACIEGVYADSGVACSESVDAQRLEQPVRRSGVAVGDAGDAAQQFGQGLAGGGVKSEHGGAIGLVSDWYSCRFRRLATLSPGLILSSTEWP